MHALVFLGMTECAAGYAYRQYLFQLYAGGTETADAARLERLAAYQGRGLIHSWYELGARVVFSKK